MLFYLSFNFILISLCGASVVTVPPRTETVEVRSDWELYRKFQDYYIEFGELIDGEQATKIFHKYTENEDDTSNLFIGMSGTAREFFDFVEKRADELGRLPEVREATHLIRSKLLNTPKNNDVNVPEQDIPHRVYHVPSSKFPQINQLIEDEIALLPLDKWKVLLERKMEEDADVAKLIETITSEEFLDILKRFKENPKVVETKKDFEDLGVDFKRLNEIADNVGDYFQKIAGR